MRDMNKAPATKRAQTLQMMAEGISLRSITRLTDISRTTLIETAEDAGSAFSAYQDKTLVNLNLPPRVRVDERRGRSAPTPKQSNVASAKAAPAGAGDIWTWVGLDADTKLDLPHGTSARAIARLPWEFAMDDLAPRLAIGSSSPAMATSLSGSRGRRVRWRHRLALLIKALRPAAGADRRSERYSQPVHGHLDQDGRGRPNPTTSAPRTSSARPQHPHGQPADDAG